MKMKWMLLLKKIMSSFKPYYLEIGIYEYSTFKDIDKNYWYPFFKRHT